MADTGNIKRVGIFGGSFNPVHVGHIALVLGLMEAKQLDLVYIIPAGISPFKKKDDYVSGKHRLAMCRLAFKDIPSCQVLDIEVKREGPSYTIDTVYELMEKGLISQSDKLYLLLGQDQLADLEKWKAIKELMKLATPLVAMRGVGKNVKIECVNTALFDVSATEIRKRLQNGGYVRHLLPNNVYTYIKRHALYHERDSLRRSKRS